MFTRYGYDNFFILLFVGLVICAASWFFTTGILFVALFVFGLTINCFSLWFFRDPKRSIPLQASEYTAVLSPADGKIVQIIPIFEEEYLCSEALQISIFLSPLDVHVNRSPVNGLVEFFKYLPGDYLVAWHPKSSEKNEQSRVGVRTEAGKVLFKQITGYLARRIVCEVKTGEKLQAGDKIGMMKFGSRMDVIVAPNTDLHVKVGDRVIGGETIIGRLHKVN